MRCGPRLRELAVWCRAARPGELVTAPNLHEMRPRSLAHRAFVVAAWLLLVLGSWSQAASGANGLRISCSAAQVAVSVTKSSANLRFRAIRVQTTLDFDQLSHFQCVRSLRGGDAAPLGALGS